MTRRSFDWSLGSSQSRRRLKARPALGPLSLRLGDRSLRFEAVEERLYLTHVAPVLNPAGTPAFTSIRENVAVGSNGGQPVSSLLASGGAGFLTLDTANGAQQGIAITGLTGTGSGAWEYSTNNGASWALIPITVAPTTALDLSGSTGNNDLIRFLPNANFSGVVSLQFDAWDQTDRVTQGC